MAKQETASTVSAITIVWVLNSGMVGVAVGCAFWFGLVVASAVAGGVG